MTLKVIYRLHAFSSAIRRTFVQHFTRFQLTHGFCELAELLMLHCAMMTGDVELVEHLLFDAEATHGATTSWMKEEFSARR